MEDLLFILATGVFFLAAAAYVRFCDRIIGPDPTDSSPDTGSAHLDRDAVSAR